MIGLQYFWRHGIKHTGAKWAPAFAVFNLCVDAIGDAGKAWVAENAAIAQGAWAEFHAPLEPGQRMTISENLRCFYGRIFQ